MTWPIPRAVEVAQSFNRVGNAPRFVFQISNFKFQILTEH